MTVAPADISFTALTAVHSAEVFGLWLDFEVVRFTNWPHLPQRTACDERLCRMLARYAKNPHHFGPFVVGQVPECQFVGLAGADASVSEEGRYDVWYVLRKADWGRGIGTATLAALLEIMRRSGRVRRFMASAALENPASWRLLERNAFHRIRTEAGAHTRHGERVDLCYYEMPA